ncbi:MAG: chemotaxis protein CheW [Clostridia bacterium]|jgi:purine-binding chemotaxis protein CheW|nr:chemotaxis protein CheW [Clostridia bacterium]MCI1999899.1 chemotaxis protein CheW [Clostridia bacterium]MCI2014185.1 chemotaxis protein CheW [Clostridia bacterium]
MPDESFETENENIETDSQNIEMQKYLTFMSNNLVYGIPIENVVEIITNHNITKLPRVPDYVKGIINLRGQIVPIIDMKQRISKECSEKTRGTCIIILNVNDISIGILVDAVSQVINIENKISAPPAKNHEFISGMTNLPDGTVMFCLNCELLVNQK